MEDTSAKIDCLVVYGGGSIFMRDISYIYLKKESINEVSWILNEVILKERIYNIKICYNEVFGYVIFNNIKSVSIVHIKGKRKIIIYFYSDNQLENGEFHFPDTKEICFFIKKENCYYIEGELRDKTDLYR